MHVHIHDGCSHSHEVETLNSDNEVAIETTGSEVELRTQDKNRFINSNFTSNILIDTKSINNHSVVRDLLIFEPEESSGNLNSDLLHANCCASHIPEEEQNLLGRDLSFEEQDYHEDSNNHETFVANSNPQSHISPLSTRLLSVGVATALSFMVASKLTFEKVSLHKLPEGFILFASALYPRNRPGHEPPELRGAHSDESPSVGLLLFFALAIHNFVEGCAIILPIYLSDPSRKLRAFLIASTLGGLTQPLGAILAWIFIPMFTHRHPGHGGSHPRHPRPPHNHPPHDYSHYLNRPDTRSSTGALFGPLFAFIAGMMLWVAADGMLPAAWSLAGKEREDGNDKHAGKKIVSWGFIIGVVLMAICEMIVTETGMS
ncbi:hypothetical protein HK096_007241 [Nowakowskiella sp. JEL0078]|nr:hypothetical protein HK096_007241 [Nowakowskiella sp. JEL0078]